MPNPAGRRVAITGLGVLSPIGNDKDSFFANLLAGKSGIRYLDNAKAGRADAPIAGVVDFDPTAHFSRMQLTALDRFSQFALVAAAQAVADADLDFTHEKVDRGGVYLGTGLGGAYAMEQGYEEFFLRGGERTRPFTVFTSMCNAAAAQVSIAYGLTGPTLTYSTACSSSAMALGEAARAIRHGYADVMIAGGAEALLTGGVLCAWHALRTLAPADPRDVSASCRPFSKDRNGLVLGEGAAVFILEDWTRAQARGARIYAELAGYGVASDAVHITKPDAPGQARAMTAALRDAGMQPEDIDYINAHGTATVAGDVVETEAIKMVFGNRASCLPVSSTKSMHGHLMGATAAVEFLVAVLALTHRAVPPTAHLRVPDPACDLDHVANTARRDVTLQAAMSNSFAFGGSNAVLVARQPERL
jgi:3-oxoacyl-[acyl-carrier-protein] synthase II